MINGTIWDGYTASGASTVITVDLGVSHLVEEVVISFSTSFGPPGAFLVNLVNEFGAVIWTSKEFVVTDAKRTFWAGTLQVWAVSKFEVATILELGKLEHRVKLRTAAFDTNLKCRIETLHTDFDGLTNDSLQAEVDGLAETSAAMGGDIETLEESVTALEISSSATGLNSEMLEESVDALDARVDGNSAAIGRLQDNLDGMGADPALEAHVNALNSRVEDNSAAIAELENKFVTFDSSGELVVIDPTSFVIINHSPVFNNCTDLQASHA